MRQLLLPYDSAVAMDNREATTRRHREEVQAVGRCGGGHGAMLVMVLASTLPYMMELLSQLGNGWSPRLHGPNSKEVFKCPFFTIFGILTDALPG